MAKQPRPPTPIHALVKQAHAYNAALRARLLRPLYADIRRGLIEAYAAAELLHRLDANRFQSPSTHDIALAEATRAMQRMRLYHRAKLIQTFRQALGVNVTGLLAEPVIDQWMRQAVSENVDLIVTIPSRFHAGLKQRIEQQLRTRPFDRRMLMEMLRDQYGASGHQLQVLTRDQTTKAVGALTHVRHEQLGITHYKWRTSQDGRVRESHRLREGVTFAWANPPADGHPGRPILCRCSAEPVIPRLGTQAP